MAGMGRYSVVSADKEDAAYLQRVADFVFSKSMSSGEVWPENDFPGFQTVHRGTRAGIAGIDLDGRVCCVKLFYDQRFFVKWRNRLGLSKARRAYRNGVRLARCGVDCPQMVGYAVDRVSGTALLVTYLVEDADRVDEKILRDGIQPELVSGLGCFIRRMHRSGVMHMDLSLRNILVRPQDGTWRFLLLDYEDARFFKTLKKAQCINNLHHLNERALSIVPVDVRREFLAVYLGDESQVDDWCGELDRMIERYPSKYTV